MPIGILINLSTDNFTQMIPLVALQMIPAFIGKMLDRRLSGGFAPPDAWQTPQCFSWSSTDLLGGTVSCDTSGTV